MIENEIIKLFKKIGILAKAENFEKPPKEEFGDLAFPCFELAKLEKRDPKEIANEIVEKIKLPKDSIIKKVEAKGAYVNFFLDYNKLSDRVLRSLINLNKLNLGKNKKILIEYSSPNPVHPIHVGSARNTFIGESLARIFEFAGYKVKRICYINDLGKQVAILVYGIIKNKVKIKPDKKPDHWLLDIYVKSNSLINENPKLEKNVDKILYLYENGDKKISSIVKKLVRLCIKGFEKTYEYIGVNFDEYIWESNFVEESKKYVEKLLKEKLAFKTSENSVVVNLEPYGLSNTVILRSDGTGLYLTRDIPSNIYRIKKYKPDLNIIITAEDQKLHFKQLFKIIELLGYKEFSKISKHLSYGYVVLSDGKLSSRLGRVVLIDDVFEEAKKKVKKEFNVKDENLAKKIGVSAVIYAILKIDPNKQVVFNWDEVLSLQGNNAPYLQYTYTRCSSILRKVEKWKKIYSVKELNAEERKIVKLLSEFSRVIQQTVKELSPQHLCNYTYELATTFNNFYEKWKVLDAETEELRNFRLTLVYCVRIVLKRCLNLICVETVERM